MNVRSTHVLEIADGQVIKRFRSWDRGEHQREWRALNVLAEFAPGLAPVPLSADLDAVPPAITMTRLPGEPLASQPITARHLDAVISTEGRWSQQEADVQRSGLRRAAAQVGILPAEEGARPHLPLFEDAANVFSERAGQWYPEVAPGTLVAEGTRLGRGRGQSSGVDSTACASQ
jgi:hypothetical protein